MLGDTFTIPHSSGNIVCNKINQDGYSSEYLFRDSTHQFTVKIRHSNVNATATLKARDRHNLEIVQTVFNADPDLVVVRKTYIVIENYPDDVDIENMDAIADWCIATSNSNLDALIGWQS